MINNSKIALKIYTLVKNGVIKTNAQFWREFSREKIENLNIDVWVNEQYLKAKGIDIICCYDESFPPLMAGLKPSEKPFLFLFKGDISLLKSTDNVAIVGLTKPDKNIRSREETLMEELAKHRFNIVSGLALGCDTIAHEKALQFGLKTIAFLPSTIENIYPPQNCNLAERIVKNGGLIACEYVNNAKNKYENISGFVARDRLQAMFANAVILIASFREGEGDSGSRHAMNKANEYRKVRLVMFDPQRDGDNIQMALNKDYYNSGVHVVNKENLEKL